MASVSVMKLIFLPAMPRTTQGSLIEIDILMGELLESLGHLSHGHFSSAYDLFVCRLVMAQGELSDNLRPSGRLTCICSICLC